ncbi:nuclear factor NF-kappa-B p105 subunit-like isoform X1 [Haliotis rubra]|uniref:nuclear factor NF-kappa-B p105 subunit-like isoform X1 n=2 Tax=Haliotis rubra TaxID=36100 RepID=UPI001EE54B4D|nr:nuclear factor NF-kappa-B p105 subunit-like isoform X1 [Haliotis rubra]
MADLQMQRQSLFGMKDVYFTECLPPAGVQNGPGMDDTGDSNDSVEVPLEQSHLPVDLQTKFVDNGDYHMMNGNGTLEFQPHIKIVEEPQQRGFRFRYECEGPSHGGLQGEKSEKSRKSYPSIKIENYNGPAKIVVTLVTDEDHPKHHAHKLVGRNCQNGICVQEVQLTSGIISFPNLCVLHVTRKKATEVLEGRIIESLILERKVQQGHMSAEISITKDDKDKARKQAQEQAKNMSLNVVRLCFQVYLMDEKKNFTKHLTQVVSRPIYDSKSPGASALKICRMDKYGGCCTGNEEVFLLCEKVQKDDISVRFVEFSKDGSVLWEAFGNFSPLDVHRQYAIVFRTPPYRNTSIDKAVNVMIMLQRKSDQETSEAKAFTYYPRNLDKDGIARKKRKAMPSLDGFGGHTGEQGWVWQLKGWGGFGGSDGGGGGGQVPHRVLLPNGNVVYQDGNVPSTIEQAIQECYDSPVNSPYRTDLDELDSPYADLSMDCEPIKTSHHTTVTDVTKPSSLKHKGQSRGTIKVADVRDVTTKMAAVKLSDTPKSPGTEPTEKGSEDVKDSEVKDSGSDTSSSNAPTEGARTDEGFSESSSIPGDLSPKKAPDGDDKPVPQRDPKQVQGKIELSKKKDEAIRMAQRTAVALREYAETGDIRYLLLVQRHLASIQNENGDLPIHLAVINNQVIALQYLLDVMGTLPKSRSRVNAFNLLRQTALHLAVITKQKNVIEILLHAGGDPSLCDRHGNTPAHLAVLSESMDCLHSLVRYIQPTANVNKPFPELDYLNYEGYAPAHLAARRGNVAVLKTLVYGQADMNLQDGKSGRTPLHHAVEVDDLPTAGYLLMETDADVNAHCFDGNTALHIACGRGLVGMVALLMTAGADPNIENEEIPPLVEEGDDAEDNSLDSWGERLGMRPADYAQENERILSILQGEIYTPQEPTDDLDNQDLQEDSVPSDNRETTTEITSIYSCRNESGVDSMNFKLFQQGDLEKLDFLTRIELAKLLDPMQPGRDVFSLAERLDYFNLHHALEAMKEQSSPTRFLLDYYEASDGTVTKLRSSLQVMDRQDAVMIIDTALAPDKPADKTATDTRVDSGMESMGRKALPSRCNLTSS